MTLRTPQQLAVANAHGFRVFGYRVEFSASSDPRVFATDNITPMERLVNLESITLGYGAEDYAATFTMWDPNSVVTTASTTINQSQMTPPKNGDIIRIWFQTGTSQEIMQFKGTIRSVVEEHKDGQVIYRCSAISHVYRLNSVNVLMTFNMWIEPVHSQPYFDPVSGALATVPKKTVAQIVDAVMDFKDAWGTNEFFTKADIDWGPFRDSSRCGGYIPPQTTFNEPKGKAIERILKTAGNFTFIYDPATDKLKVIELNRACNSCGPQWPIRWSIKDLNSGIIDDGAGSYAYEVDVESDNTTWTTMQTATTCRILSGPIWWYSGHFIMPNRIGQIKLKGDGTSDLDGNGKLQLDTDSVEVNTTTEYRDTTDLQKARVKNFEGACYRFDTETEISEDRRPAGSQKIYVGLALFPDWNVHEDFLPQAYEILDAALPDKWFTGNPGDDDKTRTPTAAAPAINGNTPANRAEYLAAYRGTSEFLSRSAGDTVTTGTRHLGMLNHLRVYQAWTTKGTCPACNGSGAVTRVYSGDNNEPQITWTTIAGGRQVPKVTNYIFDPSRFGTSDGPGSLTPFSDPTAYPEPHRNLCPYCRGVGSQPGAKIRNIRRGLVSGRHPGAALGDPPLAEGAEVDLDAIPTGPETWDSAQNRIAFQHDTVVAQEAMANSVKLPAARANCDQPFPMLGQLAPADQTHRFNHPLNFSALRRKWADALGLPAGAAAGQIAGGSWDCTVPYTTIKIGTEVPWELDERMGQVIFQGPIWVPCSKQFADFLTGDPKGIRLTISGKDDATADPPTANGMPLFFSAGRGRRSDDLNGLPTGFWRPARVWLQFFYMKEHFYDAMAGQTTTVIQAQTADGDPGQYYARAMIVDGRYCLEIRKAAASVTTGQVQIDASSEVLQMVIAEDDAVLEIHPDDFYADPIAPAPDMKDDDYATYKETRHAYPYGKLVLWLPPVPGEQRLSGEGYETNDFFNSTVRPRQYKWRLRDDRSRLLGKAIRGLESQNTVVVTGSLTLLNMQQAPGSGLGFIYYPNRGYATVKKLTYNFTGRAETVLELQRELARFGEPVPSEASKMNKVDEKLSRLERLVHFKPADQARLAAHRPQALGTSNNLMQ